MGGGRAVSPGLLSSRFFWMFLSSFLQLDFEHFKGKEETWLFCLAPNLPGTGCRMAREMLVGRCRDGGKGGKEKGSDEVHDMLLQNMAPWHLKKQRKWEGLPDLLQPFSADAGHRIINREVPFLSREERSIFSSEDIGTQRGV